MQRPLGQFLGRLGHPDLFRWRFMSATRQDLRRTCPLGRSLYDTFPNCTGHHLSGRALLPPNVLQFQNVVVVVEGLVVNHLDIVAVNLNDPHHQFEQRGVVHGHLVVISLLRRDRLLDMVRRIQLFLHRLHCTSVSGRIPTSQKVLGVWVLARILPTTPIGLAQRPVALVGPISVMYQRFGCTQKLFSFQYTQVSSSLPCRTDPLSQIVGATFVTHVGNCFATQM